MTRTRGTEEHGYVWKKQYVRENRPCGCFIHIYTLKKEFIHTCTEAPAGFYQRTAPPLSIVWLFLLALKHAWQQLECLFIYKYTLIHTQDTHCWEQKSRGQQRNKRTGGSADFNHSGCTKVWKMGQEGWATCSVVMIQEIFLMEINLKILKLIWKTENIMVPPFISINKCLQ